jgi:hypothetical protein
VAHEGGAFARALAQKDRGTLGDLLAADVDFRALTPGRAWEASGPDAVLDVLFGHWFEPQDEIIGLLGVEDGDPVEDTERVAYRLALRTPDGEYTVEQQAYYRAEEGRIGHLRILCSGFRPTGRIPEAEGATGA